VYEDSVSQRAGADITANGSDGVHILVYWGSSAFESDQWEMNAVAQNDGTLTYEDCTHVRITFDEEGNDNVDILSEGGSGYFVSYNGDLAWEGAEDESCKECVFVKNEDVIAIPVE